MRTLIGTRMQAAATLVVMAVGFSYGDILFQQAAAQEVVEAEASGPLGIGDRLKISFYETVDIGDIKRGSRDGGEAQGTLRTFYQRMDVSGEYSVEQDGAISFPLLGRFQVDGRTLNDLAADLSISFRAVTGRHADVSITVLDRSPVYVVGPVKNPGAYKYVAGMIVLHAIALAGGLDRGQENVLSMIESVREMDRLRRNADQLTRLIARRARLEALRDGLSTLPMPVQLVQLAGEQGAVTLLAGEGALLQAEQAQRQHQDKEILVRIAAARNELETIKRKLIQVDVQRDMRVERLNEMLKLKDRGVVTTHTVVTLRTELSDIEARREDNLVAVAQAEARLAEVEESRQRLKSEQMAAVARDIAAVDQEIATARSAMSSAGMLAAVLYRTNGQTPQAQTYEIVRRSKEGTKTLGAADTSLLMPGDVLKISGRAPSGILQLEQTVPDLRPARGQLVGPN